MMKLKMLLMVLLTSIFMFLISKTRYYQDGINNVLLIILLLFFTTFVFGHILPSLFPEKHDGYYNDKDFIQLKVDDKNNKKGGKN